MPIYEYRCSACGEKFDLLRSMSKVHEPADCPKCKNEARRKISTFAARSRGPEGSFQTMGGTKDCGACTSGSSCAHCG
ncbi:MAG: zinc ribbon domain-containing protein [Dehalococcoidia bacterium]|nr:zinc ribbon domain-containing protein [Dehalococcoidia bacterium]